MRCQRCAGHGWLKEVSSCGRHVLRFVRCPRCDGTGREETHQQKCEAKVERIYPADPSCQPGPRIIRLSREEMRQRYAACAESSRNCATLATEMQDEAN